MNHLTDQSLNNFYDELIREQNEILQKIKNDSDTENEKNNSQSLTVINMLLQNVLKLRNLRKKRT
jgi:hypothetical protein